MKLWDAKTGELRKTLHGYRGQVYDVAFSPEGKTLASGSFDEGVKLWDVAAGTESAALDCEGFVHGVSFASDGSTLAAASGKTVKLWSVMGAQK